MNHRLGLSSDREVVLQILTAQHGTTLDAAALFGLADAIMPYLARTRRPFEQAVEKIATNYLVDGERVKRLVAEPQTPEQKLEWDRVLTCIIEFAAKNNKYPMDTDAVSAPDLDAYEDVRKNIHTYNFEGKLDHWLTAAVINRLTRYWRDQQTIRAGGHGIRRSTVLPMDLQTLERKPAPNAYHLPLDQLLDGDMLQSAIAAQFGQDINAIVESTELEQIVVQELRSLANDRDDPLLLSVWDAIVVRGMKLREAADSHGLTISQVHRRIAQARLHLQRSPQIIQWCDR